MNVDYSTWASQVRQLDRALKALRPVAAAVGIEAPDGHGWFELLDRKLLPQLTGQPWLVLGVVGGTNIGKSVVFNHLAGEIASGVSPMAAGTKHPVCLVPPGMEDPDTLAQLFHDFELRRWSSPDDPLGESPDHLLFWRVGKHVPSRLLLLDAPDVDSDAQVNWERARVIRQAADVLIAVLTQQKYNDAAVKQFFREAAQADKPVIVVINQCDLAADRDYWPRWLATFQDETGVRPEFVYVAPWDRDAAHALTLPFYDVGAHGQKAANQPTNPRRDLASLHFDAIKIRTFRGAIGRLVDPASGVPAYLETLCAASAEYASAAKTLSASEMARVDWPTLPSRVLVEEIRQWWDGQRNEWSRSIHGFYRTVGRGVTWPVRAALQSSQGSSDPLETFRQRESQAIVAAIEKMIDELERLAKVGNDTLRPRLLALLGGNARQKLLEDVRRAHAELPAVDQDYRDYLRSELDLWRSANRRAVRFLRSLDHVAALARPAITISLAVSGFVLAGDLVGQTAIHAATHTAGEIATEAAIAGGVTGGGEAVVNTAGEGVRHAAARLFSRLQDRYTQQRAAWLAQWLEERLLGDLLGDLRAGALAPESKAFQAVAKAIRQLAASGGSTASS